MGQRKNVKRNMRLLRNHLWVKQERRCYYCERLTRLISINEGESSPPDMATLDHIIPKSQSKGVPYTGNVAVACYKCNIRKSNMTEEHFRELLKLEREAAIRTNNFPNSPREFNDSIAS